MFKIQYYLHTVKDDKAHCIEDTLTLHSKHIVKLRGNLELRITQITFTEIHWKNIA